MCRKTPFFVGGMALFFASLLISGNAFAGGWGVYAGWGRSEFTTDALDLFETALQAGFEDDLPVPSQLQAALEDVSVDFQLDHWTFGLMYDSAPARDTLLNHRFTLGFDLVSETRLQDVRIPEVDLDFREFKLDDNGYGVSAKYTLGFGLLRWEGFRWWIGPSVGAKFAYYDLDELDVVEDLAGVKIEAATFSGGGGAETGINFNLGSTLTLTASGGFHWQATGFAADVDELGDFKWGDGPLAFVQAALLFRTGGDRQPWN